MISGSSNVGNPLGASAKSAAFAKSSNEEQANAFLEFIAKANNDQVASDQAIRDLMTGANDNVQQVVMQVVKSEMSFQMFMEVRNQLIESYNDLMRMQF